MQSLSRLVLLLTLAALGCEARSPVVKAPADTAQAPAPAVGDTSAPREKVENPQYKSWAGFPKGTSAVQKTVTRAAGHEGVTTTTITYKLIDRTDEQAVIEMQASTKRYDGLETNNPPETMTIPRWFTLPPGVSKDDFGKPAGASDQGEESVTAGGKVYKTKWSRSKDRNEAGEVLVKVWTSDEVPGALVKSTTEIPAIGKTTTIELVEVKTP